MTPIHINDENIYNEFSLQHELGFFLRENLQSSVYKVQFERNVQYFGGKKNKFTKKEMDIVISNGHERNSEKYAIELKFPTNGAVPKRMFQFIKDIKFMEEVKYDLGFKKTYCLSLVSDSKEGDFYSGENSKKEDSIYQYFRGSETTPIHGTIKNPIHSEKIEKLHIKDIYFIKWTQVGNSHFHYYLLEI